MGNLIFPDWADKPKRLITRTYLGYGYWILTYNDNSKILFKERHTQEYILPLGQCKEFDHLGYPNWAGSSRGDECDRSTG